MSNSQNQHSFIICAYGDSPYLEDCIQSLLAQTLPTDIALYTSTPSQHIHNICQQYAIPIHVGTGGGIGKDWNQALSVVQTPYVTIAHQDDLYQPTYTQEILTKLQAHPNSLIVFTDYFEKKNGLVIHSNTNLRIKRFLLKGLTLFPTSKIWRHFWLGLGNAICCPAVTYNRTRLADFRFDETMRTNLDWYAWYQINQYDGDFIFVPQALMCHRIHEESETSHTIADNTRTKEDLMLFELFWPKPIARILNRIYIKGQDSNY